MKDIVCLKIKEKLMKEDDKNFGSNQERKIAGRAYIRYVYYKSHPNDENAKRNACQKIRKFYYERHHQDKDAKNDEDPQIKFN